MGLARILTGRLGTDERQITLEEAISTVGAAERTEMYGGIHTKRSYRADGSGLLGTGDVLWITIEDTNRLTPQEAADFLRNLFTPNDGRAALSYAYGKHIVDRHDTADFHKIEICISWDKGLTLAGGNGSISEKVTIDYTISARPQIAAN